MPSAGRFSQINTGNHEAGFHEVGRNDEIQFELCPLYRIYPNYAVFTIELRYLIKPNAT
jgi:hypothetical protein